MWLSKDRRTIVIGLSCAMTLAITIGCKQEIKPHPVRVPDTQFRFVDAKAKKVFLAGEFNHWNTTATPMRRDRSGKWRVAVPLLPGRYNYKFVADGKWIQDFTNPDSGPDSHGGRNSIITVHDPYADPMVQERQFVRAKAAQALAKDDFAALEKMADEFRRMRARFSDGRWKLLQFYNGLEAEDTVQGEDWKPWFDKLDAWHKAFPESITQPVVLARGWTDYAWKARGTGYANTVKDEGWRLFGERLTNAQTILEAAAKLPARCPNWYGVMQTVALGQDWDRDRRDRLVAEAAGAEPEYYQVYCNAAYSLLPRWNGEPGDWERLAEDAATKFDPAEGMTAYTRVAWYMSDWYGNIFNETAIEWPKMKQGFLDIEKAYPNSRWNLNAFCRYAVEAGDRETANQLFGRIGDHGDPNWGGYARYELARKWADPKTPGWQIEPLKTLMSSLKHHAIHSIAFSPDGKLLASGSEDGRMIVWSTATGDIVWSKDIFKDTVMSVTFSPDGKLIAAGAGEEHQTTHPGIVKVWNVETQNEIASAEPTGTVWSVSFSPDGKTLAASGGQFNKQAEASLLDFATGRLQPLDWTKEHDHGLHSIVFSTDGKVLASDCYQSITVWSVAEHKILFDKRNTLPTFSQALTFSPDGKTLAVAGSPSWDHHDAEPGGLTFWDTKTWAQRSTPPQEDAGGLYAVAYSPDGKLIAAGGQDRGVHVWDAKTIKSKAIYVGHDGPVWAVAFSPDGKTIASGSDDGTIKIWKLP